MKLNIVTKQPQETLNMLRGIMGNTNTHIDIIRIYPEVSADFDIQNDLGFVFPLETLMELTDTFKPWDIRIY